MDCQGSQRKGFQNALKHTLETFQTCLQSRLYTSLDRRERDFPGQELGEPEQSYGCQPHLQLQHATVTLAHRIH